MRAFFTISILFSLVLAFGAAASDIEAPQNVNYSPAPPAPRAQTVEQVKAKSAGCLSCHKATDSANMHSTASANIGCVDCHGGNATGYTRAPHPIVWSSICSCGAMAGAASPQGAGRRPSRSPSAYRGR